MSSLTRLRSRAVQLGYALSHLADDHKKGKKDEGDGDDAPGDENVCRSFVDLS